MAKKTAVACDKCKRRSAVYECDVCRAEIPSCEYADRTVRLSYLCDGKVYERGGPFEERGHVCSFKCAIQFGQDALKRLKDKEQPKEGNLIVG
jgi:hypothetical protein